MQPKNWNDFRFLLAIKRCRTLSAAARQLQVDDTTVSRRLAALQSELGCNLLRREGDGRYALTEIGERVAREAEGMEQHCCAIGASARERHDPCAGTVRITSVPIVINRLLAPCMEVLSGRHPGMIVELVPDSRDFNLTRREADIAVRLGRPAKGGMNIKARRIGTLNYAAFVAAKLNRREAAHLPWITYEDAMAHLPQARWIANVARGDRSMAGLRVHDAETALEAAAAGIGKTLLPTVVASRDARLRLLKCEGVPPHPRREVWLLAHADLIGLDRITTAMTWIETLLGQRPKGPAPMRAR